MKYDQLYCCAIKHNVVSTNECLLYVHKELVKDRKKNKSPNDRSIGDKHDGNLKFITKR